MKYFFLFILIASVTLSGMTPKDSLISEVRRDMRAIYMRAFFEDNKASKEAYRAICTFDCSCPTIENISDGAISVLQHYKFIDEFYRFDSERLEAWNMLKSLGVVGEELYEEEKSD